MKRFRFTLLVLLVVSLVAGTAGCAGSPLVGNVASAADLMDGVSSRTVSGRAADADFIGSMADFSIDLFRESVTAGKNSLVSPLSVTLALAMTANGAQGETLTQMEQMLGRDIPLDALNEYLYSYVQNLPSQEKSILHIANSIWLRDDGDRLQVKPDFLQRNADFYGAAAFRAAFNDQTVKDINAWVSTNTDGMIDKILDRIEPLDMLYLINAITFDAEWLSVYYENQIRKSDFTNISGSVQNVDFLFGSEYAYLEDDLATGFVKPYAGAYYSFAALLPNEGVTVDDYISSLTGDGFVSMMENAQSTLVYTSMPKFEFDYELSMVNALRALGMIDAFDSDIANFSAMGETSDGALYVGNVIHKTFISVDELGTRAGAATMVAMAGSAAPIDPKVVNLDRPFLFAIIDNTTNLPIFIGTVLTI